PHHQDGCPISRSFFARYGIPLLSLTNSSHPVNSSGQYPLVPHLAKNERDMGHPSAGWAKPLPPRFLLPLRKRRRTAHNLNNFLGDRRLPHTVHRQREG